MYLFIDTETGGLDPIETSLLTVSFHLVDEDLETVVATMNLFIIPTDGIYKVTTAALDVNKINLVQHAKSALPQHIQRRAADEWLSGMSENGANRLHCVGWNTSFDLGFIHHQLVPPRLWSRYVDYHVTDVQNITDFLKQIGVLHPTEPCRRLVDYARHFGMEVDGAHDADFDNELCRRVYKECINLMKERE